MGHERSPISICAAVNDCVSHECLWTRRSCDYFWLEVYYCVLFSCMVTVRVRVRFSVCLVSGYADVFIQYFRLSLSLFHVCMFDVRTFKCGWRCDGINSIRAAVVRSTLRLPECDRYHQTRFKFCLRVTCCSLIGFHRAYPHKVLSRPCDILSVCPFGVSSLDSLLSRKLRQKGWTCCETCMSQPASTHEVQRHHWTKHWNDAALLEEMWVSAETANFYSMVIRRPCISTGA